MLRLPKEEKGEGDGEEAGIGGEEGREGEGAEGAWKEDGGVGVIFLFLILNEKKRVREKEQDTRVVR